MLVDGVKTEMHCIISSHHEDEEQDEEYSPSECCNQQECDHLQVAYQQRWDAADQEEYLPCPGSWPSRCQCYHRAQPQEW